MHPRDAPVRRSRLEPSVDISTAFGATDKAARRAILDDLNRRGWTFGVLGR